VRREYRLDAKASEQRGGLLRRDAGAGQLRDGCLKTAFLRSGRRAQVVAPPPNAMNPLREIDDLEVRRERSDQRFGVAGR